MPVSRSISVPRTARYFTAGTLGPGTEEVWFVLHGYGHLAEEFLGRFEQIATATRGLVAPEGLSRFYTRGSHGRVGASWMTKVAREDEIADTMRYLDAVRAEVLADLGERPARVCVLGFSQGAAAACRWAVLGAERVDRLLLWAGGVPPDLDLELARERLQGRRLTLVVGRRDTLVDDERTRAELDRLRDAGVPCELVRFDGGHELDGQTLARLADAAP